METFPAEYFTYSTRYPESGTRIQLGRSYQYDEPPTAPDQRVFVLTVAGMAYFFDAQDDLDLTTEPGRNLGKLEAFYNTHKRAEPFTFEHPIYGSLTCKFQAPLQVPEGNPGGFGTVPAFEVELIEQP